MPRMPYDWYDDFESVKLIEAINHLKYIKYWRSPCRRCLVRACCSVSCDKSIYHFRFDHYVIDNLKSFGLWLLKLLFALGVAVVVVIILIIALAGLMLL